MKEREGQREKKKEGRLEANKEMKKQRVGEFFTIHLFHDLCIVSRVLKADESVAPAFPSPLVTNHAGLEERGKFAEGIPQGFVGDLLSQITRKDPEIS